MKHNKLLSGIMYGRFIRRKGDGKMVNLKKNRISKSIVFLLVVGMLTMNLNGNTENFSNPYITAMAQQSQIASSSNAEKSDAFDIYEDEIFETDLEIATPATASVASAVSLPQHSALSLLNTVNINVTDTVDLQDTIDGAGTTPTLIVLSSDVSRSSNSGAMGHHVLKIGSGQEIYLESAEGEHISIDVTLPGIQPGEQYMFKKEEHFT